RPLVPAVAYRKQSVCNRQTATGETQGDNRNDVCAIPPAKRGQEAGLDRLGLARFFSIRTLLVSCRDFQFLCLLRYRDLWTEQRNRAIFHILFSGSRRFGNFSWRTARG